MRMRIINANTHNLFILSLQIYLFINLNLFV